MNSHSTITVFVGHDVTDVNEAEFLARLRRDLARREVSATIFANFRTTRRGQQRQIDFLVLTDARLTLVELKCFTPGAALLGDVNGRWRQVFSDGNERELEKNPYEQASAATYSLSDVMRDLAHAGEVPSSESKFAKHIDTVVAFYPAIPPGSELGAHPFVTAVGYDELVDRLLRPGPHLPNWSEPDWRRFSRKVGLRRPDAGERDPKLVREQHVLVDYRRSAIGSFAAGLHDLVPLSARTDPGSRETVDLIGDTRHGQVVVLTGASGLGKTYTARHAALRLSREGAVVLWARCGDESTGRLSGMLARAAGPHSTENALTLIETALVHGRDAVLVLDGLNECVPPARREQLLEDLVALRRRHRVGVIITTIEPKTLVGDDPVRTRTLLPPDARQRGAILTAHGAADRPEDYSVAFETPLELSMAAVSARELAPDASRAELFRAYVRTRCPSNAAQAVLRAAARLFDDRLRSSVIIDDLLDHLSRGQAIRFEPAAIDAAVNSPLMIVDRGEARFSHELLGRFLAAAELVHRQVDTREIATELDQARHHDLTEFAVDLESDPARRYALISLLTRHDLLRRGLSGSFGPEITNRLRADTHAAFAEATELTASARFELPNKGAVAGRWQLADDFRPATPALIAAAVADLDRGEFFDDLVALLDAADRAGQTAAETLRERGHPSPDTVVEASAYVFQYSDSGSLPSQLVLDVLEHNKFRRLGRRPERKALAADLWRSPARRGAGLLFVALELVDPTLPDDREVLLELLQVAWQTESYYLRLETLYCIQRMTLELSTNNAELFAAVGSFLDAIGDTGNLALNGIFIECLDGYGLIEPQTTAAEINRQAHAISTADPSSDMDQLAYGLWSDQFEDEVVVGPVAEALHELPRHTRVQLLTMAVRGRPPYGWFGALLIHQLAEMAQPGDTAAIAAIAERATTLEVDTSFQQDAVGFHAEAVMAMAQFSAELPRVSEDSLPPRWRQVDELLHAAARHRLGLDNELAVEAMRQWDHLDAGCPALAVDVFHSLAHAMTSGGTGHDTSPYPVLRAAAPELVRSILESALRHPQELPEPSSFRGEPRGLLRFVIRELGTLGDESTAVALEAWVADPDLGEIAVEAIWRLRTASANGRP